MTSAFCIDDNCFCSDDNWNKNLTELSKQIFRFPNPENHNILYDELRKMFKDQTQPAFLGFNFSYDAIPNYRYIQNEIKNPEFVGIDVPSYFNRSNNEEVKKTIMIVGIDPKRSEKCHRKIISIGTPFGFNTSQKGLYWDFVRNLINCGFTVYLTDTFKLYFQSGNTGSYKIRKFTNPKPDIHQEIFYREIQFVKPDLIVTLGSIPRIWFSNLKEGKFSPKELQEISCNKNDPNYPLLYYSSDVKKIPILPLMHLSRQVRDRKKKMYEGYGATNDEELIEKYVELVKERAKS